MNSFLVERGAPILYFMVPDTCKDEKHTSLIMQQTFQAAKEIPVCCKWIRAEELSRLVFDKTNIIVIENFSVFEQAAASSTCVVGPVYLYECITACKQLMKVPWPVFNSMMENCYVTFSHVANKRIEELSKLVQHMGGKFDSSFTERTNYLFTRTVLSMKYRLAISKNITILLPEAIEALWQASQNEDISTYKSVINSAEFLNKYKCPVFYNVNVCSSGIPNSEIQSFIEKNGGHFSGAMSLRTTNILICNENCNSQKFKAAQKHKINCVSLDWVHQSLKVGYALPPEKFEIKSSNKQSTPIKDGHHVDDVMQISCISSIANNTTMAPTIIEQTHGISMLSSTLFVGKKHTGTWDGSELIEVMDVKRAKHAGAFLDGCSIYFTGFTEKQMTHLSKALSASGCSIVKNLNEGLTHIVVGDVNAEETKSLLSKYLNVPIISFKWIFDSMKNGHTAPEEDYTISSAQNPQTSPIASPASQKAVRLLRTNIVSLASESDVEQHTIGGGSTARNLAAEFDNQLTGEDDDLMAQYLNKSSVSYVAKREEVSKCNPFKMQIEKKGKEEESFLISSTICSVNQSRNIHKFTVCGFSNEDKQQCVEDIQKLGGAISESNGEYTVVPIFYSTPHVGSTIVNELWLKASVTEEKFITDIKYYHRPIMTPPSNILASCVISTTGLLSTEKMYLQALIKHMGGIVQDSLTRSSKGNIRVNTHLVLRQPEGKKYEAAVKWNIPTVTPEWVLECERNGERASEKKFTIEVSSVTDENDGVFVKPSDKISTPLTPSNASHPVSSVVTPETPLSQFLHKAGYKRRNPSDDPTANENNHVQLDSPETPPARGVLRTPDTPYGACLTPNPSPETRKAWLRFAEAVQPPENVGQRRLSTPLSELKRRFWKQLSPHTPETSNTKTSEELEAIERSNAEIAQKLDDFKSVVVKRSSIPRRTLPSQPLNTEYDYEIDTQSEPMSVGWDENIDVTKRQSRNWTVEMERFIQPLLFQTKPKFMLSRIDDEEDLKLISKQLTQLGAIVLEASVFDPSCTHLIVGSIRIRNEKFLSAIAAGKFILHQSYVKDSFKAGRLLPEDEYEFGNPKFLFSIDSSVKVRANRLYYWRKKIEQTGSGAFHDIKAILIIEESKNETATRLIKSGGGTVYDFKPPFVKSQVEVTHCFVGNAVSPTYTDLQPLADRGVLCLNWAFLSDYLLETEDCAEKHYLSDFEELYATFN